MSVTAPALCTLAETLPILVKLLGVADANYPDGSVVAASSPYTSTELENKLFQADFETAWLIVENLEHPYRTQFITDETGWLADGALITAHLGKHSRVMLKNGSTEVLGQQRDFSRLKRIKANPDVYGSPTNLYSIHAGRIHFADDATTGKIDVPSVVRGTSIMLTPLLYQWGVLANAVMKCGNVGMPVEHRNYWSNYFQMVAAMMSEGRLSLPEPEQLERLGT